MHVGTGNAIAGSVTFSALGVVGFQPLDPEMPTSEALVLLDTRIRNLSDNLHRQARADRKRLKQVEATSKGVFIDIAQLRADLDAAKLDLAVGGLRIEAAGLALIGLGLLVQMVGALVGAVT